MNLFYSYYLLTIVKNSGIKFIQKKLQSFFIFAIFCLRNIEVFYSKQMDGINNKKNLNQKKTQGKPLWALGVQMFSQISLWIVFPMVMALVVGKKLDANYGTKPKMFLILAGIGFLITLVGITRIVLKYTKEGNRE